MDTVNGKVLSNKRMTKYKEDKVFAKVASTVPFRNLLAIGGLLNMRFLNMNNVIGA